MATAMGSKHEIATARAEADRLAQSLVTRGLVTTEEIHQCCTDGELDAGPDALISRLLSAGYLTTAQARRMGHDRLTGASQKIPGYQLLEKIGQGSMGTVFKARQLSMNRTVAVKILQPRLAIKPDFLERFVREAHLAARLSHNNVVQAIDVGSAGRLHYFIMEYVEGVTVEEELKAGRIYEEREALEIIYQIAQALDHAHRRDLIHRDVKPANIILTPEGVAKLADLGMARETDDEKLSEAERGLTLGTPYYIAPEQIGGRLEADGRADVYSLGATLYHMVTGQPPFPGNTVKEVLRAHIHQPLTPPDHIDTSLSTGLGEMVEFMMAKDRADRYQTMEHVLIDLECLLRHEPPRMARNRMASAPSVLADLSQGEDESEAAPPPEPAAPAAPEGVPWVWVAVLGGMLAVSMLLNIVAVIRLVS